MRPEERDAAWLWDMLHYARIVRDLILGVDYREYLQNRTIQLAVERSIEIIGEASRNISIQYKDAHPELPWRGMLAQRNVLAHEYGEIKHEKIWVVATIRIEELIRQLEALGIDVPPENK
jgi:uncharacterized protein with HEPN domain